MNTLSRQLLTSGTALAAVVGALLLGAEDAGRLPLSAGPVSGPEAAALWPARSLGPLDARADRSGPREPR